MTKKLTKNDGMSIEQHRIEIAAAAFKALLSRRGLYQSYFRAWDCHNWREKDTPADVAWEDWAKQIDKYEWVSAAFVWSKSNIPSSVWRALDLDWFEYCEQYLNK